MNVLAWIEAYSAELEALGKHPPPAPRWTQDWFPRLDAAAAYAIVRSTRPKRLVEVGSGHSTRFMARAVADGGLATRITAIDPAPRASLKGLSISFIAEPVQRVPASVFNALEAGDILFIDSSHQLRPGSDVEHLMRAIIPRLKSGVRLHFHDIFLPDDYPAEWAWRRYNEHDAVRALLGEGFVLEFSSHQTLKAGPLSGVLARLPLMPGALESSFWLRKP
ncbi:MAG TPA: class I SAM-dependent methyltransferase [Burkholderiales bacterium]